MSFRMPLRLFTVIALATLLAFPLSAAPRAPNSWARGSVVNTSGNTSYTNGRWVSTMGPLTDYFGGIACDHKARAEGYEQKYRQGDYAIWFIAPSDAIEALGLKYCNSNPHGGEPSCVENWDMCGRKIRLSCKAGSEWCATPGSPSLLAEINSGRGPTNNYLPDYYLHKTQERVGSHPSAPRSVVLYITDFCPKEHSANKQSGACQGPQVDVSTSAFLLLAKKNAQGYINTDLEFNAELLDAGDHSAAGPDWGVSPPHPYCSEQNGRGYGDSWQNGSWTLAKNSSDLNDGSICVVR